MLSALTTAEKTLLAKRTHRAKYYLAVLKPTPVWKARVNDSGIAQGEMTVKYDNVTLGTPGDVKIGMTLWVGSTEGARDLGKVRIKAIPDGTDIEVAENSDVLWANDAYLSVVNDFEYWVKFSRIADDGYGGSRLYWDYDEGFQGQNMPPIAIAGPPACAFIDEDTGLATVSFVGNLSYPLTGDSISTYSWVFPSGTPSTSSDAGSSASPIEVTWDTPGVYWCSLEIEDNDGQTARTWRPVFIFDRTGANAPYTDFTMSAIRRDWQAGGATTELNVFGDATLSDFPEDSLVVLFAEEWYGDTLQSIGGYPYRENIKMVGRISHETVKWGFAPDGDRSVNFKAATLHEIMALCENYPQYLEDSSVPNLWPYVTGLTAKKAAYHIMKWHSTIFDIADVWLPDTSLKLASQEFAKASVWQQVDSYLSSALFAHACFDSQGALYLKHDPQYLPEDERTGLVEILDVTEHLREELDISHPHRGQTRHVELSGIYYDGVTATPIIAQSPGNTPKQHGSSETIEGLILGPQADANELAGVAFGEKNNKYTGIPFKLDGNHSYMDVAQPAYFTHTLATADTKRGTAWADEHFIPRTVEVRYDPETGIVEVDVTADRENDPDVGITGVYPTEPEDEEPEDPGAPAWPIIITDPDLPPGYAIQFDKVNGFYWKAPDVSWAQRNTGLTDTAFLCGMVQRGWKDIQGTSDPESMILFGGGMGWIVRSRDAGKSWEDVTPANLPAETVFVLDCPNDATGTLYALVGDAAGMSIYLGQSPDLGVTWEWELVAEGAEGTPTEVTGWLYPDDTNAWHGAATASIWHTNPPFPCGPGAAVYAEKMAVSNVTAGVDEDGSHITWTLEQYPCNSLFTSAYLARAGFLADFGQIVTNVTKIEVKSGMISGTSGRTVPGFPRVFYSELYNSSIEAQSPYGYPDYGVPAGWTLLNYGQWIAFNDAFGWREVYNEPYTPVDLQYLYMSGEFEDAMTPDYPNEWICGVDAVRVYGTFIQPGGSTVTPWGLAVDHEDGTRIFITYKKEIGSTTTPYLAVYDNTLTQQRLVDLSGFGVLVVYPRVTWQPGVEDFGDIVYLFGAGGAGGLVIESLDAGATLTDRSNELSAVDAVTALAAPGDGAGQMAEFYAFTDTLEIYAATAWSWASIGSIPFGLHRNSLSVAQNTDLTILLGNAGAGLSMAEYAPSPYTEFTDITTGLLLDGGCVRLEWVV